MKMARKLLCPKCDKAVSKLANKYSELYESREGTANDEYRCDDCGRVIEEGEECFASVLLPNKLHPNYDFQRPEVWMSHFINPLN
jgi:hypothetical protein